MRPFTRVLLFCKLYSKGFKSILWGGGKCCDLFVMSELVRLTSIACGLSKCLGFKWLSLGMVKSDAQVRFVLEFSVFSLFFLVCSKGSKGSGGQVCRGVFFK